MTIFDPLLFAGKAQLEKYQKDRMESWKKMKGTSKPNFDVYFEEIKKKWRLELPDETKPKESFANDFLETLNKNNQPKNDGLTAAGVYIPKEAVSEMSTELTKQEKEYIKCIALLEWNMLMIGRRSSHKSRVKVNKKKKTEKKELEKENAIYAAKIEAQNKARQAKNKKE